MTDSLKVLAELHAAVDNLDPSGTKSRIRAYRRAGLPSSSIPEGSRSSEHPLPMLDRVDRQLVSMEREYDRELLRTLAGARRLVQIEHALIALPADEAKKLASEAVSPKAVDCSNCKRAVECTPNDRLLGGRCRNCHDYLKGHGEERPRSLWESEIEKRVREIAARGVDPKGRTTKSVTV